MTPAEELRAAAGKLRQLADAATLGPWSTVWNGQEYELRGAEDERVWPITQWTYAIATTGPKAAEERAECDTATADYIATVHPGVGLALAEFLAFEADVADEMKRQTPAMTDDQLAAWVHGALTIARALNGADQ